MNSPDIGNIALGLLIAMVGGLYTSSPQWFYKKWPPKQQAWQRKLLRIFGPAFIVLGLAMIGLQFKR